MPLETALLSERRPTLLLISQVYVPDPASVGQHLHDAAAAMAGRGYRVVVYAAARGYDDVSRRYSKRETRDGVEIRRLPLSSFGKASIPLRLAGAVMFLTQAILRALLLRNLRGLLISTSPPIAPLAGVVLRTLKRVPITFWAMDINPDQAIALGEARPGSLPSRLFDWMDRLILRRAAAVIALDRYMAERLEAKARVGDRMHVIPPWPHENHLKPIDHADNPFRKEHDLEERFVVMFSGNISPSHPVTTMLEAARQLQAAGETDPLLMFIGGGLGKRQIDQYILDHELVNVRTLPYQPLDRLKYSLSAADVHLVSMGQQMVGIVHPCKGYGAMAVGRPILALGPAESHIGEICQQYEVGWQIDHGDVAGAVRLLRELRDMAHYQLNEIAARAREAIDTRFSKHELCGRFCDVVENTMTPTVTPTRQPQQRETTPVG